MATSSNEKNSSNASYAIPRKIQVIDKPSGSIKRLTVAVVVDGNYAKAPDSPNEVFTPRTEEELRRIQELVANAVGFDAQRRDSINVSSMPFKGAEIEIEPKEELPVWNLRNLQSPLLRNGLIALVLLSFVFLVMRPFVKWLVSKEKDSQLEAALAFQPQTVEQLETAVKNGMEIDSMIADSLSQSDLPNAELLAQMQENEEKENVIRDLFKETESKKEEKQLRNLILEQLEKSPKKGFRVIQEWLEEDSDKKLEEEAA
jgi:flagellar M-ring protein FliF